LENVRLIDFPLNLQRSFVNFQELIKARSGIYKDTYDNRKKGIVGQRYGGVVSEDKSTVQPQKHSRIDRIKEMHHNVEKLKQVVGIEKGRVQRYKNRSREQSLLYLQTLRRTTRNSRKRNSRNIPANFNI